jgi:hypothetical protein
MSSCDGIKASSAGASEGSSGHLLAYDIVSRVSGRWAVALQGRIFRVRLEGHCTGGKVGLLHLPASGLGSKGI